MLPHTVEFPEMAPGVDGAEAAMLTDKVLTGLLPQPLFAFTEIEPPAVPLVTVIVLVVELPDQPEGKVQV